MSWRDLPGFFNFVRFYDEVLEKAPKNAALVEVGFAFGRSLSYLARRAIDTGRHDVKIYGVDPCEWQVALGDPTCDAYRRALGGMAANKGRGGVNGGPFCVALRGMLLHAPEELERVTLLRLTSVEAAKLFSDCRAHFAFVDADHAYEPCRDDLRAWKDNAVVLAGHDHDLDGVRKACTEVLGSIEGGHYHVRPAEDPEAGDFLPRNGSSGAVWVRTQGYA